MVGSILGNNVKRVEDPRFIRGEGGFVDNIEAPDALHVALVRSPVAHGIIGEVDVEFAAHAPGVLAIYTAENLPMRPIRGGGGAPIEMARPPLAADRVRFVGDVVAAVVAETAALARDAADMVWPDIEPLSALADMDGALANEAEPVFPGHGSNEVAEFTNHVGSADPHAGSDVRVTARFRNQRLAAVPLESSVTVAIPDGDGLTILTGSQLAHAHQRGIAQALDMDQEDVRVIVPDTGGGFGPKFQVYAGQVITAAVARLLGRPAKWVESRSENMIDMCHGRDQIQDVTLSATGDGALTGLSIDLLVDAGAYPTFGHRMPHFTMIMATGPYVIPNVTFRGRSVVTNTTPTHAYRGAGRPEATAMLERSMDMLAAELGMDPIELRRRNFHRPEDFPLENPMGLKYDVGDYEASLDRAMEIAGYAELRAEQQQRREHGDDRQLGVGVCTYVEVTDFGVREWSSVKVVESGQFIVRIGTGGTGQGHETAFAQITAETFSIPLEQVTVIHGDTGEIKRGGGTGGSRSLQVGGSAVLNASVGLLDKAKQIVAHLREASPEDIVVTERGTIGVAGVPDSEYSWEALSALVSSPTEPLPEGLEELSHEEDFGQEDSTFPFGAHIVVVEVDTQTGDTEILRHIAVDDCGKILNRVLVDGQVHGGAAQGIGQALIEHVRYDEDANPVTTNLVSYLIPSATMVPSFEIDHTETPTPRNPLGAKGIGESGTIGSTAAVHNAVVDAVGHLGVRHIDMPCTPSRVWEAIQAAR